MEQAFWGTISDIHAALTALPAVDFDPRRKEKK